MLRLKKDTHEETTAICIIGGHIKFGWNKKVCKIYHPEAGNHVLAGDASMCFTSEEDYKNFKEYFKERRFILTEGKVDDNRPVIKLTITWPDEDSLELLIADLKALEKEDE